MCKIKTSYDKTTYTMKTVPQWKSLSSEKCIGEIKWLYSNQGEWTEGKISKYNEFFWIPAIQKTPTIKDAGFYTYI